MVSLPESSLDLNQLARQLANAIAPQGSRPPDPAATELWREQKREQLVKLLRVPSYRPSRQSAESATDGRLNTVSYQLRCGDAWTLPVAEFVSTHAKPEATVIVLSDDGRVALADHVRHLVSDRRRVVAIDPLLLGEAQIAGADPQVYFAIALAGVGERPCAIQAAQLLALSALLAENYPQPQEIAARGPRASFVALLAAALEPRRFRAIRLQGALASLKDLIEKNRTIEEYPELFPFGLLAEFDLAELAELALPTQIEGLTAR
jgi:hypothetical protein